MSHDQSAPGSQAVPARAPQPVPEVVLAPSPKRAGRRLFWWTVVVLVVVAMGAGLTVGGVRYGWPLPKPVVVTALPPSEIVPGASPALPWPSTGQGAVAVPSLGYTAQSGPEQPVPVASLTKLTVAVIILHDHPLPAGAPGPVITVTPADVAEYDNEIHLDESTVPIEVNEQLTERQMLEALLIVSANDIANALAVWDAGSAPAFTAKMNAFAAVTGMTNTHYADVSGYDQDTVSSATDVLTVTSFGMADPTFSEIVAMPSVTLPLAGTVSNIVSEVGSDGVIGVKSGFTTAAGGCLVLAKHRTVAGHDAVVLIAVLGQPVSEPSPTTTTTPAAGHAAPGATTPTTPAPAETTTTTAPPSPSTTTTEPVISDVFKFTRPVADALLASAVNAVVGIVVATSGTYVGTASVTWQGTTHSVPVETSALAGVLAWPGQTVTSKVAIGQVSPGEPKGAEVGTVTYALGVQHVDVPLRLSATMPTPSWWWRVTRR